MVVFGGASNRPSTLASTDSIVFGQLKLQGFSLGTYFGTPEVLGATLTELIGLVLE